MRKGQESSSAAIVALVVILVLAFGVALALMSDDLNFDREPTVVQGEPNVNVNVNDQTNVTIDNVVDNQEVDTNTS